MYSYEPLHYFAGLLKYSSLKSEWNHRSHRRLLLPTLTVPIYWLTRFRFYHPPGLAVALKLKLKPLMSWRTIFFYVVSFRFYCFTSYHCSAIDDLAVNRRTLSFCFASLSVEYEYICIWYALIVGLPVIGTFIVAAATTTTGCHLVISDL